MNRNFIFYVHPRLFFSCQCQVHGERAEALRETTNTAKNVEGHSSNA